MNGLWLILFYLYKIITNILMAQHLTERFTPSKKVKFLEKYKIKQN